MTNSSFSIPSDYPIPAYCARPDFPFLVSFPRTGSHWLRMLMEAYFEKPSLTRSFFTNEPKQFTCYHIHDLDLKFSPSNVIYLTRDPVDTLFSQMSYDRHSIDDETSLWYWAGQYRVNLQKWLRDEEFTTRKTHLTYEEMKQDLTLALGKVCHHLKEPLVDADRAESASNFVSKNKVKELVSDNPRVMTVGKSYEESRGEFRQLHGAAINQFFADFPEVMIRPAPCD